MVGGIARGAIADKDALYAALHQQAVDAAAHFILQAEPTACQWNSIACGDNIFQSAADVVKL